MKEDVSNEHTRNYRTPGSGPHRVNETISIREDMYSKLFLSSFHAEYVFDHRVQQEEMEDIQGSLKCEKCNLFKAECQECLKMLHLQTEKEKNENEPEINASIQAE